MVSINTTQLNNIIYTDHYIYASVYYKTFRLALRAIRYYNFYSVTVFTSPQTPRSHRFASLN